MNKYPQSEIYPQESKTEHTRYATRDDNFTPFPAVICAYKL